MDQIRSLESNTPLQEEAPEPDGGLRVITNRPIQTGDTVRVKGLGQTGRVERIEGGSVEIRLGSMRLRQDRSQLELVVVPGHGGSQETAQTRRQGSSEEVVRSHSSSVGTELKLIGKTTEEAVDELDR